MKRNVRTLGWAPLSLILVFTGCDDLLLPDVTEGGQILVAADADGLTPLVADAKKPRHLFWVDAETGDVERLTERPVRVSWPRAHRGGVVYVEERKQLIHLRGRERRVVFTGELPLFQPVVSPNGERLIVLEATRLGVSGRLHVLDFASGAVRETIERALVGSIWTEGGDLLVPRSRHERSEPFSSGDGEILRLRGGERFPLFRGTLPGVTVLSPSRGRGGAGEVVAVMHLEGADGPLGLASVTTERRSARRGKTGVFDFWPDVSPDGSRVLFTRSSAEEPKLEARLRLAPASQLARSKTIPTPGPVSAPRWVADDRLAFVTLDHHLVIQDLDGRNRLDVTSRLRAAYAPSEKPQ